LTPKYPDILPQFADAKAASELIAQLESGGDARITLDPETGLNRYLSGPYPRQSRAFASSTANDMSAPAFAHLLADLKDGLPSYAAHLAALRRRIAAAYVLPEDVDIVFAPSGTDLEFVALAAVLGKSSSGTHNILLGADEVGRGCVLSANGLYFADETGLGLPSEKGSKVDGIGDVTLTDIPVRSENGDARRSREMRELIEAELAQTAGQGKHALLHVVHGSKTGLILPKWRELSGLVQNHGEHCTVVVDACQARIEAQAVRDYLSLGAIVFLTGSKFMGGPPFSGFALVPRSLSSAAPALPSGFARIFRRAEWPAGWAGRDILAESENAGLALRLEASIFELERFASCSAASIKHVILSFQEAVQEVLVDSFGFAQVLPYAEGNDVDAMEHPVEMLTLATLDISRCDHARSFDDAHAVHQFLAMRGLRLGQPVKSARTGDGAWAGTIRVGLSMPQVVEYAMMDEAELRAHLAKEMDGIGRAIVLAVDQGSAS